jgi:hypothetical protein
MWPLPLRCRCIHSWWFHEISLLSSKWLTSFLALRRHCMQPLAKDIVNVWSVFFNTVPSKTWKRFSLERGEDHLGDDGVAWDHFWHFAFGFLLMVASCTEYCQPTLFLTFYSRFLFSSVGICLSVEFQSGYLIVILFVGTGSSTSFSQKLLSKSETISLSSSFPSLSPFSFTLLLDCCWFCASIRTPWGGGHHRLLPKCIHHTNDSDDTRIFSLSLCFISAVLPCWPRCHRSPSSSSSLPRQAPPVESHNFISRRRLSFLTFIFSRKSKNLILISMRSMHDAFTFSAMITKKRKKKKEREGREERVKQGALTWMSPPFPSSGCVS